ncbi:hypothetical protein [Sulfurospirillum sp. hDNRA2]|jgi:hypothetical protein|uniref:hypothetical protein n=1 Tax=Sulfurospirillum sp. hDNRA2 TaxID=3237298 RepID=UPI0020B7A0DA|nr:hypothetical protein [Sulfurospirillum sp. DNRA8]MCP3651784.1 hypothetical protein [Sulfurospirillum sp. DNRA8]MCR1810631.1 hypothetical protein [Sulfurospirillum sp. DNRA8]
MQSDVSDIFEQTLQEKKSELQACQKAKNVLTCSDCDKMFECETRKAYVKAVYESMSKGQGGGFEF